MDTIYKKSLERNLKLYYIFKIFTKRIYLPLIALYLVGEARLTVTDIALIASITTIVQIFLDIPSGYIADRWGHKRSLIFGTLVSSFSPLTYLLFPNFAGGLTASLLFFGGFSFVSGIIQAFIHDTLESLNRSSEYAKLMGKAQGYGLIGNAILISILPLTWSIDHRLPFIIGSLCTFVTFIISLLFTIPRVEHTIAQKSESLWQAVQNIPWQDLFFLFVMYGIVSSVFDIAPQYRELIFKDLGVPVAFFGFILALGSVVAAIAGRYIHLLTKLKHSTFYLLDFIFMIAVIISIGLTNNPIISIILFLLIPGYDRNRAIIAESHMLARFKNHNRKATLLSILDFYPRLNSIWVPLALGYIMKQVGLQRGYAQFGLIILPILFLLYFAYRLTTRNGAVKYT